MLCKFCKLFCFASLLLGHSLLAKVIYVDDNASEGGDGTSWATAHKYLQDALAVAEYGDEIWVAEGNYKPDQGNGKTAGDRTTPFVLVNGVGMYGGFLGTEVTRDPQGDNNQTILSGEIDSNSSLWSLNVVSGANLDANTTLDGFRITKGNANGASGTFYVNGGGAYLKDSHLSLINLIFNNNSASGSGGGSFSTYDLNLTNCVFTNNSAYYGGGIFSPSINLNNCVFTNNSAVGYGGGVSGGGTITNCVFINNFASIKGGGVRGNGTFIGCIFTSNSARDYGGGVQGDGSFTNCVFNNNSVSNYGNGGGISGASSSLNLKNCVFTNNSAVGYGGGVSGGGTITNCVFINNSASVAGGGINSSTLKLTNSILLNNFSNGFKGHGLNSADWKSIVINNAVEAEYPGDPNAKDAVYYPNLNILEGWTEDTRAFDSVPLFVNIENPLGHDGEWFTADDGLRLQAGSPAIDAGYDSNDTANYSDLAGFGRKQGENIDIGAYEYGDLKPNLVDLKIPKNLISYLNTFVTLFPERENMIDYFYHVIYGDAAEWSRTVDLNIASNKKFYYVSSHYWPWVNKSNPSKLYFPVIEADEWTQNVGSQVHSLLDVPDHMKDSIFDPKNNYVWTIQLPENGAQVLEPHLYFDISTLALPAEAGFVTEGGTFSSLTSHKFDAISYPGYRFENGLGQ